MVAHRHHLAIVREPGQHFSQNLVHPFVIVGDDLAEHLHRFRVQFGWTHRGIVVRPELVADHVGAAQVEKEHVKSIVRRKVTSHIEVPKVGGMNFTQMVKHRAELFGALVDVHTRQQVAQLSLAQRLRIHCITSHDVVQTVGTRQPSHRPVVLSSIGQVIAHHDPIDRTRRIRGPHANHGARFARSSGNVPNRRRQPVGAVHWFLIRSLHKTTHTVNFRAQARADACP